MAYVLVISAKSSSTDPPPEVNSGIYDEKCEKAQVLNVTCLQIKLIWMNVLQYFLSLIPYAMNSKLETINLSLLEVESVLNSVVGLW